MPDVTVVIVTRNTCTLTRAALSSVFASADSLAKEVAVVDNGSTDGTEAAVCAQFPKVRYTHSGRNLGFARANNLGVQGTTGEFLLLLNSDARLDSDALGQAVDWMRTHPECGIIGAHLMNPDGSPQNAIANFPTLATELLNKSLLRRLFPRRFPGKEQRFTEPAEVETVIGAFMLIRKTVWDQLRGFDERYFFFFEETDFCLQARRHEWKVFHLPQVQVWHEQGRTAGQMPAPARIEYWRSRYAYFAKNHGTRERVVLRLGLGLRLAVDWLVSLMVTLASFGTAKTSRHKLRVYSALWGWHLRGCPPEMGLRR